MPQSSRPKVSVTIITLNERDGIGRAIKSAKWADEILVVDSGSTDGTVEIARDLGARVLHNPWPGYGRQKNFAQDQATHDWVLNLDGDEALSPELSQEIQESLARIHSGTSSCKGFRFPRKNFYMGRWIRHGGWYPNYLARMADRRTARWTEPEVHEALKIDGEIGTLTQALHNYSFESIEDQVRTNLRFSRLGSADLARRGGRASVLKLILKPIGKFVETYFLKRGFLDGVCGFIISVNAAHSIFLKYAYLFEPRILKDADSDRR